jgi:prepilin-type N-terminal cleavage/methylation domain-containing protein
MRRNLNVYRAGFTLVELLVVISIIGVLAALSAAAAFRLSGASQKQFTRKTMTRLESRFKQQKAYVADRAREQSVTGNVLALAGNDRERAKVLLMKLWFKKYFPTSFAEALNPAQGYITPAPAYVTYLQGYGIVAGGPPQPPQPHESAACLYMILRHGPETAGEDDTSFAGATKVINGVPCLVDSWGNPLLYCRWPTGDPATGISPVNPQGFQPGFNDPDDPKGTLCSQAYITNFGAAFTSVFGYTLPPRKMPQNQPQSLNLTSVVVSAGNNGLLGLDPLSLAIINPPQANDNLYSSDLR